MMKRRVIFGLMILMFLASACQTKSSTCSWATGTPRYISTLPTISLIPGPTPTPALVRIGGKSILVDRVIEGPLCNDTWSGTVYVSCNVQVLAWKDEPLFFKDCNLVIEPGTVVYVAYHNDAAYYNGCSCHTGQAVDLSSDKEIKHER